MKSKIIFTILVLLAVANGCSNDNSIFNPDTNNNAYKLSKDDGDIQPALIWEIDKFSIEALNEYMVEDRVDFVNNQYLDLASYKITFSCYSNADRFTNGYIASVNVLKDDNEIYQVYEFNNNDMHHGITLNNVRFNKFTFLLYLTQNDGTYYQQGDDDTREPAILNISNVKIYKLN